MVQIKRGRQPDKSKVSKYLRSSSRTSTNRVSSNRPGIVKIRQSSKIKKTSSTPRVSSRPTSVRQVNPKYNNRIKPRVQQQKVKQSEYKETFNPLTFGVLGVAAHVLTGEASADHIKTDIPGLNKVKDTPPTPVTPKNNTKVTWSMNNPTSKQHTKLNNYDFAVSSETWGAYDNSPQPANTMNIAPSNYTNKQTNSTGITTNVDEGINYDSVSSNRSINTTHAVKMPGTKINPDGFYENRVFYKGLNPSKPNELKEVKVRTKTKTRFTDPQQLGILAAMELQKGDNYMAKSAAATKAGKNYVHGSEIKQKRKLDPYFTGVSNAEKFYGNVTSFRSDKKGQYIQQDGFIQKNNTKGKYVSDPNKLVLRSKDYKPKTSVGGRQGITGANQFTMKTPKASDGWLSITGSNNNTFYVRKGKNSKGSDAKGLDQSGFNARIIKQNQNKKDRLNFDQRVAKADKDRQQQFGVLNWDKVGRGLSARQQAAEDKRAALRAKMAFGI